MNSTFVDQLPPKINEIIGSQLQYILHIRLIIINYTSPSLKDAGGVIALTNHFEEIKCLFLGLKNN